MSTKRYILLAFCSLLVYIFVRIARAKDFELGNFVLYHLTDGLFVLLTLSIILLLVRLVRKIRDFQFHPLQILALILFYAWYFEMYLPDTSANYVSDFLDVLMYLSGGVIFYVLQRWEKIKVRSASLTT